MVKGIPKETPLIREADRTLFSWMRAVKSHYIPQAKPIPVPYCIQSVLKHATNRECCRYTVGAARKQGELHANNQLFRTNTVANCTICQLGKTSGNSSRVELATQPEIKKTTTDNIAPHVDYASCSLNDTSLSSDAGPSDPLKSKKHVPPPSKQESSPYSKQESKKGSANQSTTILGQEISG
jgi:hypothetical protein